MARLPPRQPEWWSAIASAPGGSEFESIARVLEFPAATVGPRTAGSEPGARPAAALTLPPTPVHRSGPSFETLSSSTLSPEPAYKAALGRLAQGESSVGAEARRPAGQAWPPASRAPGSSGSQVTRLQTTSHSAQTEVPAALLLAQQPPQPQAQQQQLPPAIKKAVAPSPDPALQRQLKERIEKAKAEIKQQLSPLFGVSQALLLSSQDPQQAAQALEGMAAAGLQSGFERIGSNVGLLESVRAQLAMGARAAGAQEGGGSGRGPSGGLRRANSAGAALVAAVRDNPLFEQKAGRESSEEMLPGYPASDDVDSLVLSARAAVSKAQTAIAELASPPRSLHPVDPPMASSSAALDGGGAAASAAGEPPAWGPQQGSAAEPQPPSYPPWLQQQQPLHQPPLPQQHPPLPASPLQQQQQPLPAAQAQQQHWQPAPQAAHPEAATYPQQQQQQWQPSPPVDQVQQQQQQPPPPSHQPCCPPQQQQQQQQQQQHQHHQQQTQVGPLVGFAPPLPPLPLALPHEPPAPDLEGRISQLRSRSELVIRHECERIIAAMHAIYDEFLHSVHSEGLLVRVSMGGLCSGGGDSSGGQSSPVEPRVGLVPVPTAAMPSGNPAQQQQQLQHHHHHHQQQQHNHPQWGLRSQPAVEALEAGVQARGSPAAEEGGSECGDAQLAGEFSENVAPNSAAGSPAFEFALEIKGLPSSKGGPNGDGMQLVGNGNGGQVQAEGLDFSFGSPIRVSGSQQPSPAKGTHPAGPLGSQPATAATVRALLPSPATPTFLPTAGAGVGLGGGRPAAEEARHGAYPQASLLQGGSYLTARRNLSRGAGAAGPTSLQSTSRFLQPAPAAGPSTGRAAIPALAAGQGLTRPQLGAGLAAAPAPSGQRKDLDSIVSSIRRLAAETRLKQGALANSRILQPGPTAAALSPKTTLPAPGLRPAPQQPLSAAQTPVSEYKTPLSHFASREGRGTAGVGGSRFTSLRR